MKDYLSFESARNKTHAALYTAILQRALGNDQVLIGHHICFEHDGDIATENEIPSADCLIFDHDIMDKVFGASAHFIMEKLAILKAEDRDAQLQVYWDMLLDHESGHPRNAAEGGAA